MNEPLITNDAVLFGLLMIILGVIFSANQSKHPIWVKFFSFVPAILLCYFLPSLLNSLAIIKAEDSNLYFVTSRYLLPASLILLTLGTDFKEITKLGAKAVIMFLTGTVGIIIGGPIAILLFSWIWPDMLGVSSDEVWKGMSTIAGSWIGGSANQTALKEVFHVSDEMFSKMVTVDVIVANVWMAILLIGASKSAKIDSFLRADSSAIERVKTRVEQYQTEISKTPSLSDLVIILAIACGGTGIAHGMADWIAPYLLVNYPFLEEYSLTSGFFWIIVIATTIGLGLSFTSLRKLDGAGASKIGSLFIYILIATIGMQMNVVAIFDSPELFLLGIVWMMVHVGLMILVAKLIKAPFFFVAVGSQANIGGAASAPVVASAFHPSLAPVGVLLAVLGYALGTYGAIICAYLMQMVSE